MKDYVTSWLMILLIGVMMAAMATLVYAGCTTITIIGDDGKAQICQLCRDAFGNVTIIC